MIKGCWSLISGLLLLIGLFIILKDCSFSDKPTSKPTDIAESKIDIQKKTTEENKPSSLINSDNSKETDSIIIRKKEIKVGDFADDVFKIIKRSDRIAPFDTITNPSMSIRPIIIQHYEVDGILFDIHIILKNEKDRYTIGKIILKKKKTLNLIVPDNKLQNKSNIFLKDCPKFKIVAISGSYVNILVPANTTIDELKSLIYTFREARINKSFDQLIPSLGGKINGGYEKVSIQVFTEAQWATEAKLKKVLGKSTEVNLHKFNNEYNRHIKASYDFTLGPNNTFLEIGDIGYQELGHIYSKDYERLFFVPL